MEPWLQAGKYVAAVAGGLAKRNGWTIAEQAGDCTPQRTQRLLKPCRLGHHGAAVAAPPGYRSPWHAEHWATWRRRHQVRARWYYQRTRLARGTAIALVS